MKCYINILISFISFKNEFFIKLQKKKNLDFTYFFIKIYFHIFFYSKTCVDLWI
jgi:hypothetical protein